MNWVTGAGAAVVGGGGGDGGGVDAGTGVWLLGAGTGREGGMLDEGASEDVRDGVLGFRADADDGADDVADGAAEDGAAEDGAAGDGAAVVVPACTVIDAGPTADAVTPAEVAVSGRLSAARVRLTP
ncbi:hypothetical protein ABLG96_18555 [Nakamurella sp. A5-74]|uniref:Uncharacterized protein n=1 Tax=Nakamurella sp. A5-74 TaxID=3158264 RepID=A0AAU8DLP5_9ACTN